MIYRILFIGIVATALLLTSCGGDKEKGTENTGISANTLGLVDSDLESDGEGLLNKMPEYSLLAPGSSERRERAFENAPPTIPHLTTGFFPITKDNNICLTCHMPEKADSIKSTPIPRTHFTDYRPGVVHADGKYLVDAVEGEVVSKDLGKQLSHARYYCSQCHVPQATVTVDIENLFEKVFRADNGKSRSNLNENMAEGVK